MQATSPRNCGECTACCDGWLQIEVRGHQVRPGQPCPFQANGGCSIYDQRPQDPCRAFVCGWLVASSPLPDWMRPDRSGMIMLAANSHWQGLPVDVIVAVGRGPTQEALDWLIRFSVSNRRCLVYQLDDEWFAFGPSAFQAEVLARVERGEKPWGG
jgi:hypothetical protein